MSLTGLTTQPIHDPEARNLSLLGLTALVGECLDEGVHVERIFAGTGLEPNQLGSPSARMSHRQRLTFYANAARHMQRPGAALLAGARQRLSDYGIFGLALASSATLNEAVKFGIDRFALAGSPLQITYHADQVAVVLRSENPTSLGDLLPFAAEFWRSSIFTLFSRVLEAPLPSRRMLFTYSAPSYWKVYKEIFNCPIEFDADAMEWHLDTGPLDRPCPDANPLTFQVCMDLCEQMMAQMVVRTGLVQRIRAECDITMPGDGFPSADVMARRLGLSVRTMFRRLASEQTSYQSVLDGLRRDLAVDLLRRTQMSVEDVAAQAGFSEAANFRKAFRRWTGQTPSQFRLEAGADRDSLLGPAGNRLRAYN